MWMVHRWMTIVVVLIYFQVGTAMAEEKGNKAKDNECVTEQVSDAERVLPQELAQKLRARIETLMPDQQESANRILLRLADLGRLRVLLRQLSKQDPSGVIEAVRAVAARTEVSVFNGTNSSRSTLDKQLKDGIARVQRPARITVLVMGQEPQAWQPSYQVISQSLKVSAVQMSELLSHLASLETAIPRASLAQVHFEAIPSNQRFVDARLTFESLSKSPEPGSLGNDVQALQVELKRILEIRFPGPFLSEFVSLPPVPKKGLFPVPTASQLAFEVMAKFVTAAATLPEEKSKKSETPVFLSLTVGLKKDDKGNSKSALLRFQVDDMERGYKLAKAFEGIPYMTFTSVSAVEYRTDDARTGWVTVDVSICAECPRGSCPENSTCWCLPGRDKKDDTDQAKLLDSRGRSEAAASIDSFLLEQTRRWGVVEPK
jgi:hypothetical protein